MSAVTCHHAAGYETIRTGEITIIFPLPLLPCLRIIYKLSASPFAAVWKNILPQKVSQLSESAGWLRSSSGLLVFERNISIISVLSELCQVQTRISEQVLTQHQPLLRVSSAARYGVNTTNTFTRQWPSSLFYSVSQSYRIEARIVRPSPGYIS